MDKQNPRIGVGVIVRKHQQVLLGNRINSHGHDTWNFPGGHLDFGETPAQCAIREVLEETGLKISKVRPGPWTNDFFTKENKHYITIYMVADYISGAPQVTEPHKCKVWKWFNWANLPQPLFLPITNLLKQDFNLFQR